MTTPTMFGTVTIADAAAIADVLRAAEGNRAVARILPDRGVLITGRATHVTMSDGSMVPADVDIRQACLAVRLPSGTIDRWPIAELISQHQTSTFAVSIG